MKQLAFIGFIFCCCSVSGQSPKKLNKLLRAQLVLDKHKRDSAYSVFLKDRTYLEELRSEILQKVRGPLADAEREAEKSVFAFERKSAVLNSLGIDPKTLVSDTVLPKYPYTRSRDVIKPLGEAWDRFPSFDWEKRDGTELDQYKVKEQNERLVELISSYQDKFKDNQLVYREQREYITRLEEFKPSLDRLIVLYRDLTVRADKARELLKGKINELEANYKLKGPKGFPEGYRRAFPDVHPVPVKVRAPDIVEIRETGFDLGADNVAADIEPVAVPEYKTHDEHTIYEVVEEPASFPGGLDSLKRYLKATIHYPESAKEVGIAGKVYLRFDVSNKGKISNVKILRGVPDCPECDQEALRAIKAMPDWIPGKNNGKAVNSYFTLPVQFKL